MDRIETPEDILSFVEDLMESEADKVTVIKIHHLKDEEEQHDDDLIDSIIHSFTDTLKELAAELSKKYGSFKLIEYNSDLDGDDFDDSEDGLEEEEYYIPGSFSSAVWDNEEYTLYIAVSQEDREYPITLLVGFES